MAFLISPKTRYNIYRILPFGIIFFLTGTLFMVTEMIATRNTEMSGKEVISPDLKIFLFASLSVFLFGLFMGFLEIVVFKNLFKGQSLRRKIVSKLALYTVFFVIVICITYPIAAAMEAGLAINDSEVIDRFMHFLFSVTFFNALFQLSFSLFICLIYSSISENIGHSVLIDFLSGRYAKPREEIRIFMFLDMKSSTSIAEQLGHIEYFNFLKAYYDVFSAPIIEHQGVVYEYIGDEIVITWPLKKGIDKGNCLECFFAMKKALEKSNERFINKFGISPDFKVGMHMGRVTTGEIGALKKQIIFTGDVLNTTSRIQGMCTELNSDLLISKELYDLVIRHKNYPLQNKGEVVLKGKRELMNLYALAD